MLGEYENTIKYYKKATRFEEIDNVVKFNVPIPPQHEFFVDFSDVRGDFKEMVIYRALNVNLQTYHYNRNINSHNKSLLFLAGMRGSGKTSELAKIRSKLHHPNGFFCVTCNLDVGLDKNDLEYMDILIFQTERLLEELQKTNLLFDDDIVASMQKWFAERVEEINDSIKREHGFEIDAKVETPGLLSFFKIAAKLKSSIMGSMENAEKVRTVFKNNFSEFTAKFNEFIEYINIVLRNDGKAQELLFIIDGLEKVATPSLRRKIIEEESNRIQKIRANAIFTLPIELRSLRPKLMMFSEVATFPFVKIREKDGSIVDAAMEKFYEFVYRRIDETLFDSKDTVEKAILYGGGSPRELLRILSYAYMYSDETATQITMDALNTGIRKLAAESSEFISEEDIKLLKKLKENNQLDFPTAFGPEWQDLIERLVVMNYNDGTFKCVNPIVAESKLYKHYVG